MSDNPFRVYLDPAEIGADGYPFAWHLAEVGGSYMALGDRRVWRSGQATGGPVKDLVRKRAGHRCERCGHPYHGEGEWSPCDDRCTHDAPVRWYPHREAQWRILTVHHLNGVKHDLRWWNLVALCQRCHLSVQARVVMERVWPWEHSEWFKPYAAAWYASAYLGEELTREQVMGRLDELLDLERNPA